MESVECIAAHAIAAWSLSTSAAYVRATLSRANASTPAGVSRSSAVVVMGLLNQRPPTVLRLPITLSTKESSTFGGRSARPLGDSHPPAQRADLGLTRPTSA